MRKLSDRVKENKKVKLFVLTKRSDPDTFLCMALSKNDVIEYAHRLLRVEHLSHFESWCSLRSYNSNSVNSWMEYYSTCIPDAEKHEYIITNVTYRMRDIIAIMRMFGNCDPLGCSFESPVEFEHAESKKELLECQIEFEKFWREHHQDEIKEAVNGTE